MSARPLLGTGIRSAGGETPVFISNWSGYAQVGTKDQFTGIVSSWIVPTVDTKVPGSQSASDWVGIDGVKTKTLVQAGTASQNIVGKAKYFAWTEIIPHLQVPLSSLVISPGDAVSVVVSEVEKNIWSMVVDDITSGKSETRTVDYTTPGRDAEVIHERPAIFGRPSTLATTNNVRFGPTAVSITPPIPFHQYKVIGTSFPDATLERIFMGNHAGGEVFAAPSALADKECFTVADGNKSPPRPSSCPTP